MGGSRSHHSEANDDSPHLNHFFAAIDIDRRLWKDILAGSQKLPFFSAAGRFLIWITVHGRGWSWHAQITVVRSRLGWNSSTLMGDSLRVFSLPILFWELTSQIFWHFLDHQESLANLSTPLVKATRAKYGDGSLLTIYGAKGSS